MAPPSLQEDKQSQLIQQLKDKVVQQKKTEQLQDAHINLLNEHIALIKQLEVVEADKERVYEYFLAHGREVDI